jgi:hypothetical protein
MSTVGKDKWSGDCQQGHWGGALRDYSCPIYVKAPMQKEAGVSESRQKWTPVEFIFRDAHLIPRGAEGVR